MPATEHFFRNQKKLHVVFALSCVALLVSVIWMMVEDYSDPWRAYQSKNFDMQAASKARDIRLQTIRLESPAKLAELDSQIAAAEESGDSAEAEKLQQQRDELHAEYVAALDSLGLDPDDQNVVALKAELADVEERLDFKLRLRLAREAGLEDEAERLELFIQVRDDVEKARNTALRLVESLKLELKNQNAQRDEERANFDLAVRDGLDEETLRELYAEFEAAQAVCDETQLELEAAEKALASVGDPEQEEGDRKVVMAELNDLLQSQADLKKSIDKLEADLVLVQATLQKIRPEDFFMKAKRKFMELPIVEGFNGHQKVTQDWLPDLHQTLGMTSIARFDRCRTCHMNVDLTIPGNRPAFPHGKPSDPEDVDTWVAENKFPHPYATHPNHELFVTAASPHPVATFGCTACHDGQGSGTDFGNAEHTPNDPHQAEQWHHEFGYHPNHFWEYPMKPERFQEATCIKCHHKVVELGVHPKFGASAPKVVRGFNLIRKYGCFGCHEIHGFDAGESIGPDMRLEPQTAEQEQRIVDDPTQVAGLYRKVGPSLRHIAAKTSEAFIAYWVQDPQRFRPSTKMPRYFDLHGHLDPEDEITSKYEAVELAGLARVLVGNSEEIELLKPAAEYVPNVERGETLFGERGCLACHQHDAAEGAKADFGPNISDIHRKVRRNEDNKNFSDWLYTWIREPTRYHKRTRMPNLYLETYAEGEETIDPAADIVAFLLSRGESEDFESKVARVDSLGPVVAGNEEGISPIDSLVTLYLKKARFSDAAVREILESRTFPRPAEDVSGDESVFATEDGSAVPESDWEDRKLRYIGLRTVSRYGCYACHDIPGYESARPIAAALQDWGRKDTSKLAFEHVEEYLHHHGEPDGGSTRERVETALARAKDGTVPEEDLEPELTHAFFYDSLLHHGRAGFLWQKLRAPRSYDYMKTETKGYDERLRMPKFPLKPDEIEAIETFVLGLIAEPPAEQYVYTPDEREKTRIEGEFLLAKYNCTGCHMVELPQITFGLQDGDISPTDLTNPDTARALDLLLSMHKPHQALTGESAEFVVDDEKMTLPLASFRGMVLAVADPEDDFADQETSYTTWQTLDFGHGEDAVRVLPNTSISVTGPMLHEYRDSRGGEFAEWLVKKISGKDELTPKEVISRKNAWQMSPPPLYKEGYKVQTAWLHKFLLNPMKVRHATVLRMPQFNMSSEEAGVLANYFAAVDGAPFPYNQNEATSSDYLVERAAELRSQGLLKDDESYLDMSWRTLNGLSAGLHAPTNAEHAKCVGCHSVGGLEYSPKPGDKTPQGPDLRRVQERLRPDWVKLWLHNPAWTTPYTAMPNNYPAASEGQVPSLFGGDPSAQVIGVRDALMNYAKLMETHGIPEKGAVAVDAADAAAAEE